MTHGSARWSVGAVVALGALACVRPAPAPDMPPAATPPVVVPAEPETPAPRPADPVRAPAVGDTSRPTLPAPVVVPTPRPPVSTNRPDAPDSRASTFVILRGGDTLAIDSYTRTAGRVRGELLIPSGGLRQTYDMALRSTGTVTRLDLAAYRIENPRSAPPAQSLTARFDSAGAMIQVGGQTQRHEAPAMSLPFINLSAAVIEQILLRAKALGGTSAEVPVIVMSGAQNVTASVQWLGADSAVVTLGPELRVHVSPAGELLGGLVPSQDVRFVRQGTGTDTGAGAQPSAQAPDYSAPAGAPYRAEEVTVRNEAAGVTLAGTLTMPLVSPRIRVPAVVLITGSGPQDRDQSAPGLRAWRPFRQIADTLTRRGIAVLRLDDRGVGGSDRGPVEPTSAELATDVSAALAYLRSRMDIDATRLALLGHSEGALIAPMVASEVPAVRAVVLIAAPSRIGRRISDEQIAQVLDERGISGTMRDSLRRVNDRARDSVIARSRWVQHWMSYDPLPAARRLRAPVLILHGATDRQVSAEQAEELASAIRAGGNRDVTVRIFPEMNHLLVQDPSGAYGGYATLPSHAVRPDLLGAVADWLVARLALR